MTWPAPTISVSAEATPVVATIGQSPSLRCYHCSAKEAPRVGAWRMARRLQSETEVTTHGKRPVRRARHPRFSFRPSFVLPTGGASQYRGYVSPAGHHPHSTGEPPAPG